MKLLVVGGGGREHAIIKSLKKNPEVTEIFALPGNGGIAADAVCVPIGATEIDKIVAFAQEQKVDYAVVAPDDPLVLGCVDALEAAKIPCFGPRARAAIRASAHRLHSTRRPGQTSLAATTMRATFSGDSLPPRASHRSMMQRTWEIASSRAYSSGKTSVFTRAPERARPSSRSPSMMRRSFSENSASPPLPAMAATKSKSSLTMSSAWRIFS